MDALMLAASYPMGDDTPILLYAVLGIVGIGLVAASVIMGKKGRKK